MKTYDELLAEVRTDEVRECLTKAVELEEQRGWKAGPPDNTSCDGPLCILAATTAGAGIDPTEWGTVVGLESVLGVDDERTYERVFHGDEHKFAVAHQAFFVIADTLGLKRHDDEARAYVLDRIWNWNDRGDNGVTKDVVVKTLRDAAARV